MRVLTLLFVLVTAHCIPDCEHTYIVVPDCDHYSLLGPAIYQPALLQWCPALL